MLEVQLATKNFMKSKDKKELEEFRRHLQAFKELISRAETEVEEADRQQAIKSIAEDLIAYQEAFQKVIERMAEMDEQEKRHPQYSRAPNGEGLDRAVASC